MVAAIVADTETTAAPGPTPNSSPAVIVSGTAGRANTSSIVYKAPYAGYLRQSPSHIRRQCGQRVAEQRSRPDPQGSYPRRSVRLSPSVHAAGTQGGFSLWYALML